MNTYTKAGAVLALTLLGAGCSDFLQGPGLTENPNNPTTGTALQACSDSFSTITL